MAEIEIQGLGTVEVPDSFRTLSADQQAAAVDEIVETATGRPSPGQGDRIVSRGAILPFVRTESGERRLGLPGFIFDSLKSADRIASGEVDVTRGLRPGGEDILNLGGLAGTSTVAVRAAMPTLAGRTVQTGADAATAVGRFTGQPLRAATREITQTADEAADRLLAGDLRAAGVTPDDVINRLDENEALTRFGPGSQGVLPENIADIGGTPTQRRLDTSVLLSREGEAVARERLQARQGRRDAQSDVDNPFIDTPNLREAQRQARFGRRSRVLDNLALAFRIKSEGNAVQTAKSIRTRQRDLSDEAYRKAFNEAQPFDIRGAINDAMAVASEFPQGGKIANKLLRVTKFFQERSKSGKTTVFRTLNKPGDLRKFDRAKRELDQEIRTARLKGENELARELQRFRDNLMNSVHGVGSKGERPQLNRAYQDARQIYESEAKLLDSLDFGRRALREDTEVTRQGIGELTEGELKTFRIGLFRDLEGKVKGSNPLRVFEDEQFADIIAAATPRRRAGDPRSRFDEGQDRFRGTTGRERGRFIAEPETALRPREQIGRIVARERNMQRTEQAGLGSQTAGREQAVEQFTRLGEFATRLRERGLISGAIDIASASLSRMLGVRERSARILADRLTSTDPVVIRETMERIRAVYGDEGVNRTGRLLEETIGGAVSEMDRRLRRAALIRAGQEGVREIGNQFSGSEDTQTDIRPGSVIFDPSRLPDGTEIHDAQGNRFLMRSGQPVPVVDFDPDLT